MSMAKTRRTVYALNKNLPIPTSRITEIVNQTTLHTPSSFNSQSNRVLVLFGAEHDKFWTITEDVLREIVPPAQWEHTGNRIAMFRGAAGSVLFFDDQASVDAMAAKFPLYADKFPGFASQSCAMQQYLLWTALSVEGLGCNLQHYNPIVDQKVRDAWDLPATWTLNAQLVFGGREQEAGDKEFAPLEERVKVAGQ